MRRIILFVLSLVFLTPIVCGVYLGDSVYGLSKNEKERIGEEEQERIKAGEDGAGFLRCMDACKVSNPIQAVECMRKCKKLYAP